MKNRLSTQTFGLVIPSIRTNLLKDGKFFTQLCSRVHEEQSTCIDPRENLSLSS